MNRNAINIFLLALCMVDQSVLGQILPTQTQSDITTDTAAIATATTVTTYATTSSEPDAVVTQASSPVNGGPFSDFGGFPDIDAKPESDSTLKPSGDATQTSDIFPEISITTTTEETGNAESQTQTSAPLDNQPFSGFGGLPIFNKADLEGDANTNIAYDFSKDGIPVDNSKVNAAFYIKPESNSPLALGAELGSEELPQIEYPGQEAANQAGPTTASIDELSDAGQEPVNQAEATSTAIDELSDPAQNSVNEAEAILSSIEEFRDTNFPGQEPLSEVEPTYYPPKDVFLSSASNTMTFGFFLSVLAYLI